MSTPAPNWFPVDARRSTALTDRQQEIATLVCAGLSNKMIARKLDVTEGTVKIHLHVIYKKLDVRSRMGLIVRFGSLRKVAV
jgi:DNA-binding NarL/FixJ family response regulator